MGVGLILLYAIKWVFMTDLFIALAKTCSHLLYHLKNVLHVVVSH